MRSVDLYSFYIVYLTVLEVAFFRAIRRTHGTSPRETPRRPPERFRHAGETACAGKVLGFAQPPSAARRPASFGAALLAASCSCEHLGWRSVLAGQLTYERYEDTHEP